MPKSKRQRGKGPALTVTIDDIRAAEQQIAGSTAVTPLAHSTVLSEMAGCEVWLKLENLQFTASFKERGALVKLQSLSDAERKAGVVAASAGNHAQGVAFAAQRLGIPATIVMPKGTPFTKISRTEALGATIVLSGESLAEAAEHAETLHRDKGLALIHPYDDPLVIAGQGTIALEVLENTGSFDAIVVPIGGGGLISGVAIGAKAVKPDIEIFGVEAELYPSMHQALKGVAPEVGGHTIADGIAVKNPGTLTRPIVEALVNDILLVSEAAIEQAVQILIDIEKTVAEGAGAAALAGLFANKDRFAGKRVCVIVSGGNIDSRILASILMRGLVREGRLIRIRVEISDAPGALAKVATLIGDRGGNIVEIYHQRLFQDVPVKLADLDVVLETRDRQHVDTILSALREAGFETRLLSSMADAD
jgi:threonine dehydratase